MRELKLHIITIVLTLTIAGSITGQEISQTSENVDFVTDRDLYLTNEKIWFAGEVSSSFGFSKIVYVDIFDNDGRLMARNKYDVLEGLFSGYLQIPHFAETGYYVIRVYTNFQKNFPLWQITKKVVRVVNPTVPLAKSKPELINPVFGRGLTGKIIFRLDPNSLNDSCKFIIDNNDSIINGTYKSFTSGLGYFTNEIDWNSTVKLFMINGRDTTLCSIYRNPELEGITLSNELGFISVEIDSDSLLSEDTHLMVTNLSDGFAVSYTGLVSGNKFKAVFRDNKNHTGICEMVLVSNGKVKRKSYFVLADYFVLRKDILPNDKGKSVIEGRSVATSVLKGTEATAENDYLPGYLFKNPLYINSLPNKFLANHSIIEQLQILIDMNYGLIESTILNIDAKQFESQKEVYGPVIQGRVSSENTNTHREVFCSFIDYPDHFYTTISDTSGFFNIQLGYPNITGDVYLTSDGESGDSIQVYSNFIAEPPSWSPVQYIPDSSISDLLTHMYLNYQYNEYFNNSLIIDSIPSDCSLELMAGNLKEYITSDYIQMPSTKELFNEVVPFVKIRSDRNNHQIIILDEQSRVQYSDPLVMVDNIYFKDIDHVMDLQPSEIVRIEVIPRKYFYGKSVFNGVIRIETTKGILDDLKTSANGVFFKYNAPERFSIMNTRNPDLSNTQYWKIITTGRDYVSEKEVSGYKNFVFKF